jgi:hypothetical protein
MTNSTNNGWEKAFGARRRAIDRSLLVECERQIAAQEHATLAQDARWGPKAIHTPPERLDQAARAAIARAFGRPMT